VFVEFIIRHIAEAGGLMDALRLAFQ
jgi:hypothetical protein